MNPDKATVADAQLLETYWPFRGPCLLCGHDDARHRIFDAIQDRHASGESVFDLAYDYNVTTEVIEAVLSHGCDSDSDEVKDGADS